MTNPTQAAFNVVGLNNNVLGGIEAPNYQRRETQKPLGNDGQYFQTGASVVLGAPMASFSTIAVRALMAIVQPSSTLPLPWIALDGTHGLQMWGLIPNASGPGYASGSVHPLKTAVNGDFYVKSLRWAIGGDPLVAECEAFFTSPSNGATDPVASSTVAAPTLAINTEQLQLSGMTANGTAINSITRFDLDITHKGDNQPPEICNNSGMPFPVQTNKAGVGGQAEIIATFETTDLVASFSGILIATFNVSTVLGVGYGSTGMTATINGTIIRDDEIKGQNGSTGKRQVKVRGTWNGTLFPLAFANF